ncbi:MAG: hypothetical protein IJI41_13705 [Anaerolineaceae bacterium]|nr:hypothetical protein [Anaerolineaceae bacterium]
MIYKEEKRNLFTLPGEYMLAHCISSDYALGAGIAKIFKDKLGVKDALLKLNNKNFWDGKGRCEIVGVLNEADETVYVVNLITKCRYFQKPTYRSLEESLSDMKKKLVHDFPEVRKIGMPLIGCGLDKLQWNKVSEIIKQNFEKTDYEIIICYL